MRPWRRVALIYAAEGALLIAGGVVFAIPAYAVMGGFMLGAAWVFELIAQGLRV